MPCTESAIRNATTTATTHKRMTGRKRHHAADAWEAFVLSTLLIFAALVGIPGLIAWWIYLRFLGRIYKRDGVEGVVAVATALPFRRAPALPAPDTKDSGEKGQQEAA